MKNLEAAEKYGKLIGMEYDSFEKLCNLTSHIEKTYNEKYPQRKHHSLFTKAWKLIEDFQA